MCGYTWVIPLHVEIKNSIFDCYLEYIYMDNSFSTIEILSEWT